MPFSLSAHIVSEVVLQQTHERLDGKDEMRDCMRTFTCARLGGGVAVKMKSLVMERAALGSGRHPTVVIVSLAVSPLL